jgi:5-methylcytosine-specific restriction protein A
MPWAPPHHCRTPGCPNLVPHGTGKCATHRSEQQRQRKARETWRDYDNPAWLANRAMVLQREPRCRFCQEPATVVDHIKPLKEGGTHDISNLRPLCKSCHDRHTHSQTLGKDKRDDI